MMLRGDALNNRLHGCCMTAMTMTNACRMLAVHFAVVHVPILHCTAGILYRRDQPEGLLICNPREPLPGALRLSNCSIPRSQGNCNSLQALEPIFQLVPQIPVKLHDDSE